MKGTLSCWVLGLVLLLALPAGHADMCDDIGALADAWNQLADGLDELTRSEMNDAESEQAEAALAEGIDPTRSLAEFLIAQGGELQESYGAPLEWALNALEQAPDWDSSFVALEKIINVLDEAADSCAAEPATPEEQYPAPRPAGTISISYHPAPDAPGYPEMVEGLKESGVYEVIAETVASAVALPVDLPVVFTTCGMPNAFYDPSNQQITMCYEFFVLFASAFLGADATDEEVGEGILGAGAFFFLHEIGHALVHLFEIPITGREEDSVDSLATLILLHGEVEGALFAAIQNFGVMADSMAEGSGGQLAFWDEHSLNAQRLYDVACLIYGSNPETYAAMVGEDGLPEERAVRCPGEFQQKNQAWDVLLGPHFTED